MQAKRTALVNQVTQAHTAVKAETIPQRRIFMMGNGKPVQPSSSKRFCDALVDGLLGGTILERYEFALGFAACFDAISRGTIDMGQDPLETIKQAYADIENITVTPNKITDIMRIERD